MLMQSSTLEGVFQTVAKIQQFKKLSHGWHYGRGVAPSEETARSAGRLLIQSFALGFKETDAFPGVDGEIQLTVYQGKSYLEFTIESSGRVTAVHEEDGIEKEYAENLSFDEAVVKLKEFNNRIWKSSGLSITTILTAARENSRALPLRTQATEAASQWSTRNAHCEPALPPADISIGSTPQWLVSLRFSGTFPKESLNFAC